MNVRAFLDQSGRTFEVLEHPATYTALGMAHAVHVSGHETAKSVILKADGRHVLAVLPASRHVDLEKARTALQADTLELADEADFARLFPDCERGALPPFGSRYGLTTMVDEALTRDEHIVFEGNTLNEAIRMAYRDYAELEQPRVADFSRPA